MEADFWHQMWAGGSLGFHQNEINAFLTQHWPQLALQGSERVLVPLCGKSKDMLWLAEQGHSVLGVELSETAVDAFFAENQLAAKPINHDCFAGAETEAIQLYCGDFFKLSAQDCKDVKAVYDRAAIVALPEAMRQQYVAHLKTILPKGTRYLIVIMDYDQSLMSGPPFSVTEDELRTLFSDFESIEKVEEVHFARKGVATKEMAFVMTA